MNRREYLTGLAAVTAAVVPWTVRAQAARVRVASGSNDAYALSYFAKDGGFFKQAGIDPDIQLFLNAQASLQAMIGGALDVVVGDAVQVGNAFNSGVAVGFFAPSTSYASTAPTTYVCAAKDGTIRTAKDLENKAVAVVALSSLMTVGIQQWLKDNGADGTKVKLVEMNFPAMAAAVARGTVGAAILAEPFLSAAPDVRLIGDPLAPISKEFLLCGMIATRQWVSANRDVASRFAKACSVTAAWANSHREDTAKILAEYSKTDVATVRAMKRATFSTTIGPRQIQPVLDMAFTYGQLQKPVRATDLIIPV
jgi:NitT/TauT family transport system substrate-binding protein